MFQRAILQSPAFEPRYNATCLQPEYTSFDTAAGCAQGSGLACLRSKTAEDVFTIVSLVLYDSPGSFAVEGGSITEYKSTVSIASKKTQYPLNWFSEQISWK